MRHFSAIINPLPWPHGIVKCPLDAHFTIPAEVVGHVGTFSRFEF